MKFKVGDKVRTKETMEALAHKFKKGDIGTIIDIHAHGIYQVLDPIGHHWILTETMLEPVASTLAEIKEKKLTCCINVKNIAEAQFLDDFFECKSYLSKYCENAYKERMRLGYYRTSEDGVAFQLTDGVINDNCSANFYRSCGGRYGEVYEFSDLFPVGSTMMCGNRMYQCTEGGITNYKLVPEYKEGGITTLKSRDESMGFESPYSREFAEKINKELVEYFNAFPNGFRGGKKPEYVLNEKQAKEYADNIMATAELISDMGGISYENSINKLKTCLSAFPNDGISAKNGGKNSMKFIILCYRGNKTRQKPRWGRQGCYSDNDNNR